MQKKYLLNFVVVGIGSLFLLTFASPAQTWQLITANVPGAVTGGNTRPMDTDGTRLYVLGDRGVYVSSDNGASFNPINDVSGTSSYTLTNVSLRFVKCENGYVWIGSDPGSAAINFGQASLHRSTPGQTTWQKSSSGFPIGDTGNQADDIAYDASTGTYYVAAALGGALVSTNGTDWVQRTTGLGGIGVPATVVAFNDMAFELRPLAQVHKTSTQGASWSALTSHQGIYSGFLLEMNGRVMFATTGNTTLGDGLYYTDDYGATWHFLTGIKGEQDLSKSGGLIYSSGGAGGIYEAVYGRPGFKFSATQGITWDTLPTNGLAIDSFSGFTASRIVRQENYLFMHSFTNLYRLDVSGFDFRPTTQIARQPNTSYNRLVGQPLLLDVLAGGTNLTYQWRLNGTNLVGATNAAFTVASAQTNNSGPYTVVLTGDRGSVTSTVSTVTVATRIEGKADITYPGATTGGKLFLLPDFSLLSVNGANLYKINSNGVLLTTRNVSGSSFTVSSLDSSNRLLLGNSTGVKRLRRVNSSDLTDDATFNQLTANISIDAVTELPGRGYLVAGNFTSVTNAGISTNALTGVCLVNYSGVVDPSFSVGTGADGGGGVTRIVVDSGTNIYALGFWLSWNSGPESTGFVKLNTNGTRDVGFTSLTPALDRFLQPLTPGKLLFVDFNGKLVVMNSNGTVDSSFNSANRVLNNANTVRAAALGESNKLYIAGTFTSFGGTNVGKYMRLNSNGTIDTNFFTQSPSSGGFVSAVYDSRGYLEVTRDTSSGTLQGQAFSFGPYRILAGTNAASLTGFAAWRTQFTFPLGLEGESADADGDGLKNVFEYYFGSVPTNALSGAQPTATNINVSGQDYPAITFIRSQNVSGVTLLPQVATDVLFSNTLSFTIEPVVDLGNGTERVTIRSNTSIAAQVAQFLRIQLSMP